jgi:DNA-binding NtrC family response regulator
MESKEKLLVVSRSLEFFETLKDSILARDFQLLPCGKDDAIFTLVSENGIRFIILEAAEPQAGDLGLLQRLRDWDTLLTTIVFSPAGSPDELLKWIRCGASEVLVPPLDAGAIHAALRKAVEKRDLRRETFLLERKLEKKYVFQGMVSRNPYMFEIFSLIENIAPLFTSVLITGETGTGKEMVARALHNLSGVRNKRLVVCDCASIPENLFESELFGYVRGAFTGADRTKKGLFEDAHEGVIFLDEIGEIPIPVQAKLLRVLENRQFRPLGSNEIKDVDVRIIAATNRDLAQAIQGKSFRDDLYHRINRFELRVPPLRDRIEDIPLLIRHFLENMSRTFGKDLKGVSRDVQKLFLKYDWRGNIRELENVLQSGAMIAKKDFIDIADLPKNLMEAIHARISVPFPGRPAPGTLDDMEKEYIVYVLNVAEYNLKKAAKILDVSRTTLYNKMARYSLVRERPPSRKNPRKNEG